MAGKQRTREDIEATATEEHLRRNLELAKYLKKSQSRSGLVRGEGSNGPVRVPINELSIRPSARLTIAISTGSSAASSTSMSSRSRPRASGARGGIQEAGEEGQLWKVVEQEKNVLARFETKAKDIREQIFALERQIKAKEDSAEDTKDMLDKLDLLYRDSVKNNEEEKAYIAENITGVDGRPGELHEKILLLKGLVSHTEQNAEATVGRGSSSRSAAADFDRPSDSPGPSAIDNKHVRKIGNGRNSSQPPRSSDSTRGDVTPAEVTERATTKPPRVVVVFHKDEEVAFKPKIAGKTEEHDWIQGIVTRVIGEGKSRRYEVRDPFPDENAGTSNLYKSSASSMVPIPPVGAALGDYEVGKQVLALYPDTTTFYRAEVRDMLNGGASVQLLFEDEAAGALKVVERRMVLDHKG